MAAMNDLNPNCDLCVFVYGTLKPGGRFHQRYCSEAIDMAPALVKGHLYNFPRLGYPGMTVGGDWVKGYLIRFQQDLEAQAKTLRQLDWLEGYKEGRSASENDYQRLQVPLFTMERQPLQQAWGYVMAVEKVRSLNGIYLPSGTWPS